MRPECSKVSKDGKSSRLSLQVLQPAAGDKENLVGGSRQSVTNVKVGDKREKVTEYTVMKGSLKKKKVTQTSTQTDREDKPKIAIADLTSDEPPSEDYWQLLAEKRRTALEECLQENQALHERLQLLEEEKRVTEQMLEESRNLVEILKEIVAGETEAQDDSEGDSSP